MTQAQSGPMEQMVQAQPESSLHNPTRNLTSSLSWAWAWIYKHKIELDLGKLGLMSRLEKIGIDPSKIQAGFGLFFLKFELSHRS